VNRSQDFVCRADFCSKVRESKHGVSMFTYVGDGLTPPEHVLLISEQATVVIDNIDEKKSDSMNARQQPELPKS